MHFVWHLKARNTTVNTKGWESVKCEGLEDPGWVEKKLVATQEIPNAFLSGQ